MRVGMLVLLTIVGGMAPMRCLAADVVIYRCTDPFGALTVQNDVPCPKGSKQQKQIIQAPPAMPAYRPADRPAPRLPDAPVASDAPVPAPPANAAPASTEPAIADSERLPPPPLFQCNTYDNDSYLSENAEPEPRCVRLQTTDLEGIAGNSAGVACQMVTDQCQRVADGAACGAWKQRLRELEAAWKFARAEDAEGNRTAYERARVILRDSTCGK
jgi:hypothetical protein